MELGIKAFDSPELAALRQKWEATGKSIEMRILEGVFPVLFVLSQNADRWTCLRYFQSVGWNVSVDQRDVDLLEATQWLASRPNRRV